jgi:hypothetical protein
MPNTSKPGATDTASTDCVPTARSQSTDALKAFRLMVTSQEVFDGLMAQLAAQEWRDPQWMDCVSYLCTF